MDGGFLESGSVHLAHWPFPADSMEGPSLEGLRLQVEPKEERRYAKEMPAKASPDICG